MPLPSVRLQLAAMTLAEEMNFTRAAERLGITQPALSKQIKELEATLGFLIFYRLKRKIELSDAGQMFVRGCLDSQAILEGAIRSAKAVHDEVRPIVTLGHSPYADPSLVAAMLGVHLPLFPHLRLRIESMFAHELAHGVMVSELDIALITEPTDTPHLTRVDIATDPLCAVMPDDHPAAAKQMVMIEDFRNVGWMLFPRRSHPAIYDRFMEQARVAQVSPVEVHHYVLPQECIPLIAENFGVAFVARGIAEQLLARGIAVRPLAHEALHLSTHLVLRADESSRLVNDYGRAFLRKILPQNRLQSATGQLSLGL